MERECESVSSEAKEVGYKTVGGVGERREGGKNTVNQVCQFRSGRSGR